MNAETDTTGSYVAVEGTLEALTRTRHELEALWSNRKLQLDLCLQLRLFERDSVEVQLSAQFSPPNCAMNMEGVMNFSY